MTAKILIKRTATPNAPPTGLQIGELSVEMGDPTRLWVGVPTAIDPSGRKLLLDRSAVPTGAAIYVGDTPPSSPATGQLWWESDSGLLFVYYDDGNTKQWVSCTVQGPKGKDGTDGTNGTNGTNGVSGALLTAAGVTTQAVIQINSGAWSTGDVTEGVQILSTPIQVKSATSKLRLRGGATMYSATAGVPGVFLYTSLASGNVGNARSSVTGNSAFAAESGLIAHGQPVGTIITCSMRGSRSNATVATFVNGTAAASPYTPPATAWLAAEEVT